MSGIVIRPCCHGLDGLFVTLFKTVSEVLVLLSRCILVLVSCLLCYVVFSKCSAGFCYDFEIYSVRVLVQVYFLRTVLFDISDRWCVRVQ